MLLLLFITRLTFLSGPSNYRLSNLTVISRLESGKNRLAILLVQNRFLHLERALGLAYLTWEIWSKAWKSLVFESWIKNRLYFSKLIWVEEDTWSFSLFNCIHWSTYVYLFKWLDFFLLLLIHLILIKVPYPILFVSREDLNFGLLLKSPLILLNLLRYKLIL